MLFSGSKSAPRNRGSRMRPGILLRNLAAATCIVCGATSEASTARAQEGCPLGYLSCSSPMPNLQYYQEAARETVCAGGSAGYDLGRGEVRAHAQSFSTSGSEAGTSDEFVATGPGTTFTIRARLSMTAVTERYCSPHGHCGDGFVRIVLREGPGNEASHQTYSTGSASIHVTIQGVVGVPFQVFASVLALATYFPGGYASVTARLDFADLPAGFRITSCGGYGQDAPVAVSQSSWGRLKRAYR
jgi:hypothetical protein